MSPYGPYDIEYKGSFKNIFIDDEHKTMFIYDVLRQRYVIKITLSQYYDYG